MASSHLEPVTLHRVGYVLETEFRDALEVARQVITRLQREFATAVRDERQKGRHRSNRANMEKLELLRKIQAFEDHPVVYERITRNTSNVAFVLKSDYDKDMARSRAAVHDLAAKQELAIARIVGEYQDQAANDTTRGTLEQILRELQVQDFACQMTLYTERHENDRLRARLARFEPEVDHHRMPDIPARLFTISPTVVIPCPLLKTSFVDVRLVRRKGEEGRIGPSATEDISASFETLLSPKVQILGRIDNFSWTLYGRVFTRDCFVFQNPEEPECLWLADKRSDAESEASQDAESIVPSATDTVTEEAEEAVEAVAKSPEVPSLVGPDGCLNNEGRGQIIGAIAGVLHDTWPLTELGAQVALAIDRLASASLQTPEASCTPVLPAVRHNYDVVDHSPTTDTSMLNSQEQHVDAADSSIDQTENRDLMNWRTGALLSTPLVDTNESSSHELLASGATEDSSAPAEREVLEQETDAEDEDNFEDC